MIDMELFYSYQSRLELIDYANGGYLFDPHKGRSQIWYLFMNGGTVIS